jgi:hypothetical protein
VLVYVAAVLTLGGGIWLAPLALALTIVAYKQTDRPRGLLFAIGVVANVLFALALAFVGGVAIFIHDQFFTAD